MTALYIVLGIFLLLALILLSSITLKITYSSDFSFVLSYGLIKYKFASKNKRGKNKAKKKKAQTESKDSKKNGYIKQSIESKGLAATVTELAEIIVTLFSEFGGLLEHLRIKKFKLFLNVASSDPAATAVEYGTVCAVVYPLVRLVEQKTVLSRKGTRVIVNSDFNSQKSELEFELKGKLRVICLLASGFKLIKALAVLKPTGHISKLTDLKR